MLATLKEVLTKAQAQKYAVGNFDVYNTELLFGVMRAAEKANSPVILAYGGGFDSMSPIEHYSKQLRSVAECSPIPVVLMWDHAASQEEIDTAIRCGFTSVMMDASSQPFEDNIRETKIVVEKCKDKGISVESELGHVGDEHAVFDPSVYAYTDPAQAAEFVERTGIDALAIAIGNQHGVYTSAPQINLDVLERVRANVSVPLVLHGASGIGEKDIQACIDRGITKVNIHTELCQAAATALAAEAPKNAHYHDLCRAQLAAVEARTKEKIYLFRTDGKA